MNNSILIGHIEIQVERKNIKNMYLRIIPPDGKVKMTVPRNMSEEAIRRFAFSRIGWIEKHKTKIDNQPITSQRQYISGEYHYLWGKRYQLRIEYTKAPSKAYIDEDMLVLQVKAGSSEAKRKQMLESWYREQLTAIIPPVLNQCIQIVGKSPNEWRIKNMKTRWGTCNIQKKRIWLNLQLAKKPVECLAYVITHELVHLYVAHHNDEFKAYMNQFCPNWRAVKKVLNERYTN